MRTTLTPSLDLVRVMEKKNSHSVWRGVFRFLLEQEGEWTFRGGCFRVKASGVGETEEGMLSSQWGLECGDEEWPWTLALFISGTNRKRAQCSYLGGLKTRWKDYKCRGDVPLLPALTDGGLGRSWFPSLILYWLHRVFVAALWLFSSCGA